MMTFTQGNLLEADVEAVVNTVNTVGVMGKGIALMFKERFPENFKSYAAACKAKELDVGHMFVQPTNELSGPRWVINFPTKKHWRYPTKLEWIVSGLKALRHVIAEYEISSLAIPPLGCGNGGLEWNVVRPLIEAELDGLEGVEIQVYEPTTKYQNVAKRTGVEELTPARALVAEMVRRYWILGIECTILEIQKLSWFLERYVKKMNLEDPLKLDFSANMYGPYAHRLTHLLDGLDGSYLHCDKRLADASPFDTIWFDEERKQQVHTYLYSGEAKKYTPALEATDALIDGFQSPLCMEALSTVDWLVSQEGCEPTLKGIREGLNRWPGGEAAANRKHKIFTDRLLSLALEQLRTSLFEQ
ncbi:MAG: Appr-1-p processing protein [Nitrospiraceae bacterium]|nr:Appr-1-p processing protein [Nitrospiraceae bacterium]